MSQLPELRPEGSSAIAAYKAILQEVLERRPSGTRQRLAQSLEKARSFVTQITNPAYPVPIPAQHLSTIFEICHFSRPSGSASSPPMARPIRAGSSASRPARATAPSI